MNETKKLAIILTLVSGIALLLSVIYSTVRPGLEAQISDAHAAPEDVFRQYCSACHGPEGSGTDVGPRLHGRKLDTNYVRKMIVTGTHKMPPIRNIHEPLLSQVATYVKELP